MSTATPPKQSRRQTEVVGVSSTIDVSLPVVAPQKLERKMELMPFLFLIGMKNHNIERRTKVKKRDGHVRCCRPFDGLVASRLGALPFTVSITRNSEN